MFLKRLVEIGLSGLIVAGLLSVATPGVATVTPTGVPADLTVAMATVAMADETQSIQTFRNRDTGRCIDDSAEFGLRAYGCNYGPHQQWNVRVWNDGTRELRNVATGGCISDSRSIGMGIARCESSRSQSWFVRQESNGIKLINESTNRCLVDYDGRLQTMSCIAPVIAPYELWY